ncbi:MAG: c-type cytochrome [Burkholderiaceae bacterium]
MLKPLRSVSRVLALTVLFSTTVNSQQPAQTETPSPAVTTPIESNQQLMARRALACTGCHGKQGVATASGYFPRIAGKPAGYLLNQLRHFRSGQRQFEGMNRLVRDLPDAYLAQFARYFESLQLPYPEPIAVELPPQAHQRAVALINDGDPDIGVPACVSCHGKSLTGVYPSTPGLLGLPRDYVIAQFGAWQNGLRQAGSPDCMAKISHRLKPGDVVALADWLAGQPIPADSRPNPSTAVGSATKPSLSCAAETPGTIVKTTSSSSTGAIEHGHYLTLLGNCAGCHDQARSGILAGGDPIQTPFGTVFGSNISADRTVGIGRWSKAQFTTAMTLGRSPDGASLNPVFPYQFFNRMTHADIDAIYDWLRTGPASDKPNRQHELRFPYGTEIALNLWRWLFTDLKAIPRLPDWPPSETVSSSPSPSLERGRYLVDSVMHCNACHGRRNFLGAFKHADRRGGQQLPGQSGYAPSLTSATETPLGVWTPLEIARFLQTGHTPQADANGLMARIVQESTQHLSDEDALSAGLYLRSKVVPAEPVKRLATSDRPVPGLWERHCSDCHGKDGQGKPDLGPALAGRQSVQLANPVNLLTTILYGGFGPVTRNRPSPPGMPGFAYQLTDQEIALLANIIRNSWGNSASRVIAAQVQESR